jgi:transposase
MQRTIEQRYAIKLCVGLGKSGTETLGMIRQVFKDESMSQTAIFKWHKLFKDGREGVEDEPRAGRPWTSRIDDNVQRVREMLNSDHRLSVRMVADEIGIDKMTVHNIITGAFCLKVLRRLKRRVNRVRSAIAGNWKLHHDNAPSHTCSTVTEYLTINGITTIPQPPYSPDLAPADFFLFPKVKSSLKGHNHGTLSAVKEACTRTLKDVPESVYQGAFESWKSRWQKCIDAQGMYFEDF